jgi:hypothetical protein
METVRIAPIYNLHDIHPNGTTEQHVSECFY